MNMNVSILTVRNISVKTIASAIADEYRFEASATSIASASECVSMKTRKSCRLVRVMMYVFKYIL